MRFMKSTNGHPLAATLLLISMYAFAWAFHLVTRPSPALPAHPVTAMAALPPTVRATVPPPLSAAAVPPGPVAPVRQAAAPAPSPAELAPALTEIAPATAADESPAALPAFAWSIVPTGYPAAPLPGHVGDPPRRGAVSGGLATAAAAMRSSLRLTDAALKSVF